MTASWSAALMRNWMVRTPQPSRRRTQAASGRTREADTPLEAGAPRGVSVCFRTDVWFAHRVLSIMGVLAL